MPPRNGPRLAGPTLRVRQHDLADGANVAGLIAYGLPEPVADMLLGLFVASRQGEFAPVDPTPTRLIGRPPTPLRDVLKAAISPAG